MTTYSLINSLKLRFLCLSNLISDATKIDLKGLKTEHVPLILPAFFPISVKVMRSNQLRSAITAASFFCNLF